MNSKFNLILFGTLQALLTFKALADSKSHYHSKISLRSGYENLLNQGTSHGATSDFGNLNISYQTFFNEKFGLGFGYLSSFDLTKSASTISGMYINAIYSLSGSLTKTTETSSSGVSEVHDPKSYYVGTSYSLLNYYLGKDPVGTTDRDNFSGKYSTINAFVGAQFRMSKTYEFTCEIGKTLLTLAASDERVRISHTYALFGLNYIF